MNGIQIALPAWGDQHIDMWLRYVLPSLLAPGNLPLLSEHHRTTFNIYTNSYDRTKIETAPIFKDLVDSVHEVAWNMVGNTKEEMGQSLHPGCAHGGTMMKVCHNYGIQKAFELDDGFIPAWTDVFFADGFGHRVQDTIANGKRALMALGINIAGSFTSEADTFRKGNVIAIDAPRLAKLLITHLGAGATFPAIEEAKWSDNPGNLRWGTRDGRGILIRPMHVNVHFAHAEHLVMCGRGVDNDYADRALSNWDQVELITDSSVHLAVGIDGLGHSGVDNTDTPREWRNSRFAGKYNPIAAALWFRIACNDWHVHWSQQHFWITDGTVSDAEKYLVEDESDAVMIDIYREYERMKAGRITAEEQEAERLLRM